MYWISPGNVCHNMDGGETFGVSAGISLQKYEPSVFALFNMRFYALVIWTFIFQVNYYIDYWKTREMYCLVVGKLSLLQWTGIGKEPQW